MTSLRERLDSIERRRIALLDEAKDLDASVLQARPLPGKWSIGEIIEHLVLAERDVLGGLPDPADLEAMPRRLKNHLLYAVVMFVLRYDIPVKAPSRAMIPTGDKSLDELREMWDANHAWIRSYLDGLDDQGRRRAVFAHPVTGPLTPGQAVRMLDVHLVRHIRQIRRLRRELGV